MQVTNSSQLYYDSYASRNQSEVKNNDKNSQVAEQNSKVEVTSEVVKVSSGYDYTQMTSSDMLSLAASFHKEGNIQDFLSLAVLSADAALEDHPDPTVSSVWRTSRNEDGTFNLLDEIHERMSRSSGQNDKFQHLLDTLLSMPSFEASVERRTIDIVQ